MTIAFAPQSCGTCPSGRTKVTLTNEVLEEVKALAFVTNSEINRLIFSSSYHSPKKSLGFIALKTASMVAGMAKEGLEFGM